MIHALISGVIAFGVSVVLGWPILRYLQAQKGKSISEYAPDTHQKKAGTPTFGGLMIWVPTFLVAVIAVDWWDHRSILLPLAVIGATGVVGFVDDLGTLQHRTQHDPKEALDGMDRLPVGAPALRQGMKTSPEEPRRVDEEKLRHGQEMGP